MCRQRYYSGRDTETLQGVNMVLAYIGIGMDIAQSSGVYGYTHPILILRRQAFYSKMDICDFPANIVFIQGGFKVHNDNDTNVTFYSITRMTNSVLI